MNTTVLRLADVDSIETSVLAFPVTRAGMTLEGFSNFHADSRTSGECVEPDGIEHLVFTRWIPHLTKDNRAGSFEADN